MLEITDGNFNNEVTGASGLVLVDFWAAWCRPCHALAPILERVETQNPQVKVGKVNIDENPDATSHHNVNAVPTVLLFKDGQVVKRFVGLQTEGILNEAITANS